MTSTAVDSGLPCELWLAVLNVLPVRNLLRLQAVSHGFLDAVVSIVRARLLKIVKNKAYELVFQAHQPHETVSSPRHVLQYSRFPSASLGQVRVRFLTHAAPSQTFLLESYEQFATLLLAVHLKGVVPPPVAHDSGFQTTAEDAHRGGFGSPTQVAVSPIGSPSAPASLPSYLRPRFAFCLSVAEGLDRVFRSAFEQLAPSTPGTPTYSHLTRRKVSHVLHPSSASALVAAGIQCTVNTNPAGENKVFEYEFDFFELCAARLMVNIEEGMNRADAAGGVVLWFRR